EHATELAEQVRGVSGYASANSRATLVSAWLHIRDRAIGADVKRYHALAIDVLRDLRRDAFLVPMTKPTLAFLEGEIHWREGRRAKAIAAWRRASADATRMQLP